MKRSIISIALCVALVLSSMCAMFVMPASANENIVELKNLDYVVEGAENVTVNEDGSWTITGNFAMAVNATYDINTISYIYQHLDAATPVKITLYDGYANKWIGLYDNWVGPQYFPVGEYNSNDGVIGIYNWNKFPTQDGIATLTSIYFEFEGGNTGNMTLYELYLNDGFLKPAPLEDKSVSTESYDENDTWNASAPVVSLDPADWAPAANNAALTSEIVVTNDAEGNLVLGNTAGTYPAAYTEANVTVPYEGSALYFDFTVTNAGQTTIYLFFGAATETDFDGEGKGYYAVVGDVMAGNYTGYVYLQDVIAADSDIIDADGNVTVSVVKAFGSTAQVAPTAVEEAVIIREVTAYYNEVAPSTYVTFTANGFTHDGTIKAGEEITVDVTASEAAGFAGFKFDVAFDDAMFEFAGYEWGSVVADLLATDGAMEVVNDGAEAVDGVKEVAFSAMALEGVDVAADDVIVSVTLKAKAAVEETFEVAVNDAEAFSFDSIINGYELVAESANAVIEVIPSAYLMGDADGSGEVDIFDAQALFQYVNEVITADELNLEVCDFDGNGEKDIFDAQTLFQYVNEVIDEL